MVSGKHVACPRTAPMISDVSQQSHLNDSLSMQDSCVLLRDIYRVARAYAVPIASHPLQVYHSVLTTVPKYKLLHCVGGSHTLTPRLVSQRVSDWYPIIQVMETHESGVSSVAYSTDGLYIVSGSSDGTVRVCDAQTGNELAVLEGHSDDVTSVAFSPDGTHIVSGSDDRTVRVWNAQTGKVLAVLEGHSGAVISVAFSPDGAHIVSGSYDKTVQLWDAHTGKELAVLEGHNDYVTTVAFTPDGEHIISRKFGGHELAWNVQGTAALLKQPYVQKLTHTSTEVCSSEAIQGHSTPKTHASHTRTEAFVWDQANGWISWGPSDGTLLLPLCWIPVERRGDAFACHGTKVVLGARGGIITILDFSDVISMLGNADQAPST
jgi:WD40 repeat protein